MAVAFLWGQYFPWTFAVRPWSLVFYAGASPAWTAVTAVFMHAGWLHLIMNMLFLYLCGCNMEDRWGRLVWLALYLGGGVAAALTWSGVNPGSESPLVGASGAIAAAMGAFLVTNYKAEIRIGYFIMVVLRPIWGVWEMRAYWAMPLWLLGQVLGLATEGHHDQPVAYSAHVGGFAFGAGAALALKHYKVEERWLRPGIDRQVDHVLMDESGLDNALRLRSEGDSDGALARMVAEAGRRPGDRHLALALWKVAAEEDRLVQAMPAMLCVVQTELRAGHDDEALEQWRKLIAAVPDPDAEPALLVSLARLLAKRNEYKDAAAALRLALLDRRAALTPALGLAIARTAAGIEPGLAAAA